MATLEQVEKLRERANVTFEEARAALDEADGDLLDAVIILERQGKVSAPQGGSYSEESGNDAGDGSGNGSGENADADERAKYNDWVKARRERRASEHEHVKSIFSSIIKVIARLFDLGNTNFLDANRHGETVLSCPVTALVLLLAFFFWIIVPLLVLSLFFGWSYRFRGAELGRDAVNNVMAQAENAAEGLKDKFSEDVNNNDKAE
jgi:hypothetical protein